MNTEYNTPSVRQSLAIFTRAAHLELHKHEWISALAQPSIDPDSYYRVLMAYRTFYQHVESRRAKLACFSHLSLEDAISALDKDVLYTRLAHDSKNNRIRLVLNDQPSVLGALYVLHGAGFGASILNRNIKNSLPLMKRHFLSAGTPRSTWQHLNSVLEDMANKPDDIDRLEAASLETFQSFGAFVTLVCENQPVNDELISQACY